MLTRNYCEYVVYLQKGKVNLVADAETAGEAYIRDIKSETQKMDYTTRKTGEGKVPYDLGAVKEK